MKIGIIGGTFDPPHIGHLIIANEALHQLNLDKVYFMPNQEPPHKVRNDGASGMERIHMLEMMIQKHPRFFIEPIELEREGRSYSYDTMKILTETNKEDEYFFIIGGDMVEYLPKWYKIDELVSIIQFVGVNRPGYSIETDYPIIPIEVPLIELSSTMLRDRLKSGQTVKYYLPDELIDYIKERGLYGATEGN